MQRQLYRLKVLAKVIYLAYMQPIIETVTKGTKR